MSVNNILENLSSGVPTTRQPVEPVGHTVVTGMDNIGLSGVATTPLGSTVFDSSSEKNSPFRGRDSLTDVSVSVSKTLDFVVSRVPSLGDGGKKIVESLLWVFLARRSNREVPFTIVEFGRFRESMVKTAEKIAFYQSDDCREQSFVKYHLDLLLAKGFRDVMPPPEKPVWLKDNLFFGWCRIFVLRSIVKRDLSFLYSLSKGCKQMWLPLSELNLAQTVEKTISRLTVPSVEPVPADILASIRRTSRRIFSKISPGSVGKKLGTKLMPTTSACSQASVRNGGALSLFRPLVQPKSDESRTLGSLRSLLSATDTWRKDVVKESIDNIRANLGGTLFDVKYSPVYEPAKIRGVSVGDGYLYTLLQPLQGEMLDCWKNSQHSTMRLSDLSDAVNEMDNNVPEEYWCSGDYEAATDLLKKKASLEAFVGIRQNLLSFLAYLSLATGRITFPNPDWIRDNFNGVEDSVHKRTLELPLENGQLMGHPLSFPLLCVINLAVLEHSVREWISTFPIGRERLLAMERGRRIIRYAKVNGDDILFKAPLELIEIFKKVSSSVGFKISAGKNYVSRDSCMINSQMFRRIGGRMIRFGYLNLRLVKGVNVKARVAGGENSVNPVNIGKDLTQMVDLCPWSLSAVPTAFHRWDKESRDFKWFRPNWYLPTHLGGYGFDWDRRPEKFRVTRGQRLLAAMMISDPSISLFRAQGVPIKVTRKLGALFHPSLRFGDYVMDRHEVEMNSSLRDWESRFMYINLALHAGSKFSNSPPAYVRESLIYANRLKRNHRFSPIRSDHLEIYFKFRLFVSAVPPCPPQNNIYLFDVENDWDLAQH